MENIDNISDAMDILINKYEFNTNTLAKYLKIDENSVLELKKGNINILTDDLRNRAEIMNKIMMLVILPDEIPDLKVNVYLDVLINSYKISHNTIAKMANIELEDVENMMENPFKVSLDSRYKISAVVMALRFLFK